MQKRNTEMKNTILATADTERYDASAKRIISQKCILAEILVVAVTEFQGMDPKRVEELIEGNPVLENVPVEPGLTNIKRQIVKGTKIVGLNTENQEEKEGLIRFDIIFYVRCKDGVKQIIINIEIQKDEPQDYNILNRATFYVCRMISSQKERDFVNSDYDNIKPVYSIWICMNMKENSLTHIHLMADGKLGKCVGKDKLDLVNIVMIGLKNELPEKKDKFRLHRLLNTIFSEKLAEAEKIDILKKEYEILPNQEFQKEMREMCNLGQGILERGIEQGTAQKNHTLAQMMIQDKEPVEKIERYTGYTLQNIRQIAKEMNKTL